jgi:hypothetical protein
MSELTKLLKLDESADDAIVLAEVVKVTKERDEALTKLAEGDKADRIRRLDEAINSGDNGITPAKREAMVTLAESDPVAFNATLDALQGIKVVDLSERGDKGGDAPEPSPAPNASVELAAEVAELMAAEKGLSYSLAQSRVLAKKPDLKARYAEFRGTEG